MIMLTNTFRRYNSKDILAIKGPTAVQEYIVNDLQQSTDRGKINDKHFGVL